MDESTSYDISIVPASETCDMVGSSDLFQIFSNDVVLTSWIASTATVIGESMKLVLLKLYKLWFA